MPIESSLRAFSIKETRYERFSYEITDVIPFSLGTLGSNAIDDCGRNHTHHFCTSITTSSLDSNMALQYCLT